MLIRTDVSGIDPVIKLQPGLSGHITWLNRTDMTEWTIILAQPPKMVLGTDTFALAFPKLPKEKKATINMPKHCINVRQELEAGRLRYLINRGPFDEVRLTLNFQGKTAKQQINALCSINQYSNPEAQSRSIVATVPPILMGQGLKKLTKKSIYSKGFAEAMLKDPSELNKRFAEGIKIPGTKLSKEQLNMVLKYPSEAPSDGLLVANGPAESRKTTSIGAFATAQYLDINQDESRKTGVIVCEMHGHCQSHCTITGEYHPCRHRWETHSARIRTRTRHPLDSLRAR